MAQFEVREYLIPMDDKEVRISMPVESQVIGVALKGGTPVLFVMCDKEDGVPTSERTFRIHCPQSGNSLGTGEYVRRLHYIGWFGYAVQQGWNMVAPVHVTTHVFEVEQIMGAESIYPRFGAVNAE